jgi:hypothetical protein
MPIGFNPSQYQLGAYTAPLVPKPVQLCATSNRQSQVLPLNINWTTVAPTFAVAVYLNQGAPGQLLVGGIQGVYIDNSNNESALILVFPDTGYELLCPASETRYFPVFSNANVCNIYNGSLTNSLNPLFNNITLLFTNFLVQPFDSTALQFFSNLVIASSQINGTIRYISQVVGDNHSDVIFTPSPAGQGLLINPPPISTGFFIITSYTIAIMNATTSGISALGGSIGIRYGVVGTIIISIPLYIQANNTYLPYTRLADKTDAYILMDATQTINAFWTLNIPGAILNYSIDFLWTTSQ